MTYTCSTFYALQPLSSERRQQLLQALRDWPGDDVPLNGMVLVAADGINATVAGSEATVQSIEQWLAGQLPLSTIKRSQSAIRPYRRWKVVERREVVTSKVVGEAGTEAPGTHLTPAQWHQMLSQENVLLLDVRNDYEVALGTFPGARNPRTGKFSEMEAFVDSLEVPTDQKILAFCTGGIRCEKAVPYLRSRGYSEVYQLDGGILNYLQAYPQGHFEGECFVFDERVALDGQLQPTVRFTRCSACGQPIPKQSVCSCGHPAPGES